MTTTSSTYRVSFFYDDIRFVFRNRNKLKGFIPQLFSLERKQLEGLNYIFCSDEKLLEINRQFLNHDYYTDIITFDLSESKPILGEIYISIDRVKDNASREGVSFEQELHRVIFHGALHLCGYGDISEKEEKIMRKKEDEYLTKYFV